MKQKLTIETLIKEAQLFVLSNQNFNTRNFLE